MLDAREQQNAPVWLGETGENSNVWFTSAVQLLESNNIGWSWWPLKKLGNNNPLQIPVPKAFSALVDYWNGRTKTPPSKDETAAALMQLAANSNIRSNIIHYDVTDALFRQPFSFETKPFAEHNVGKLGAIINAVDYDLGRNGVAYFDKDSGNYSGSPGSRMVGNRGYVYRNDGVDIYPDSSRAGMYYVGNIEDAEWLQYSFNAGREAVYDFALVIATVGRQGKISIMLDGKIIVENVQVISNGKKQWQELRAGKVALQKGPHKLRLLVSEGGFNLKQLLFKN